MNSVVAALTPPMPLPSGPPAQRGLKAGVEPSQLRLAPDEHQRENGAPGTHVATRPMFSLSFSTGARGQMVQVSKGFGMSASSTTPPFEGKGSPTFPRGPGLSRGRRDGQATELDCTPIGHRVSLSTLPASTPLAP